MGSAIGRLELPARGMDPVAAKGLDGWETVGLGVNCDPAARFSGGMPIVGRDGGKPDWGLVLEFVKELGPNPFAPFAVGSDCPAFGNVETPDAAGLPAETEDAFKAEPEGLSGFGPPIGVGSD